MDLWTLVSKGNGVRKKRPSAMGFSSIEKNIKSKQDMKGVQGN
jgi:hypothetical protein